MAWDPLHIFFNYMRLLFILQLTFHEITILIFTIKQLVGLITQILSFLIFEEHLLYSHFEKENNAFTQIKKRK